MQFAYEPFVQRRLAEGRIFFANCNMPFEYFLDCFQAERPFFIVSQLQDGRITITPNAMVIPKNWLQAGFAPHHLLPNEYEYVTLRDATYPVIMTAHPVGNAEEWLRKFEKFVWGFAKQTLTDFVTTRFDFLPLKLHGTPTKKDVREAVEV